MSVQYQIIGGGLIGLATAYALLESGAESVRIIEAREGVALETSFANAGMLHVSLAEPWNRPGIGGELLGSLFHKNTSLKLRATGLVGLMGWGRQFLKHSTPDAYWQATQLNTQLAIYALQKNMQWRENLSIDDGYEGDGLLKIYRSDESFARAQESVSRLREFGANIEICNAKETVLKEAALKPISESIAGALYYPDDYKADAYVFCKALEAEILSQKNEILYNRRVENFVFSGDRVCGVETHAGILRADTTIIAAGAYSYKLLAKLGLPLPIRPVKGYSLSFSTDELARKHTAVVPHIPVVDDSLHAAITPLPNCIRVAGIAELAGFNPKMGPTRLAPLLGMLDNVYPDLAKKLTSAPMKAWHGFRPVSADGRPFIGESKIQGLAINTGHAHMGWTFSAGAGALLADVLLGKKPMIDQVGFAASRVW
ncbi:MAG: hypothetical protein COA43_06380 [Robiginitomaculum sp.]|nr:MAG: hypothetical protein COA43_06380 [Robiginitomaculum sp.]